MDGLALRYVTVSGSYRKFPEAVSSAIEAFRDCGINVLSPKSTSIVSSVDGFVSLSGDLVENIGMLGEKDITDAMRLIENSHLKAIQQSDALWLEIPGGYCGISTAFEAGWALAHNVPVFYDGKYSRDVREPVVRAYASPVRSIRHLVDDFCAMPKVDPMVSRHFMRQLLEEKANDAHEPGPDFNSVVAAGPLLVDYSGKRYRHGQEREVLLVKTHKWGGRFSIMGDKLRKGEKLKDAFDRVVKEQAGISCLVKEDICVFDEIDEAGYYQAGLSRIFADKLAEANNRNVVLDSRAEEFIWVPPSEALRNLSIEPNARNTLEEYCRRPRLA